MRQVSADHRLAIIGDGGDEAALAELAGRVPVIIGRGPSHVGWQDRYPSDRFYRIAINPFGRNPQTYTEPTATPDADAVEAWSSFDPVWRKCVPRGLRWTERTLWCSPFLAEHTALVGSAFVFDKERVQPLLTESQSVLIAALATCGAKDVVICGCDLAGEHSTMYIRRARLLGETDRIQFTTGIRVWMDPQTKFPELAKPWRDDRGGEHARLEGAAVAE